jgi:uroporphyrinogen decarboxylase
MGALGTRIKFSANGAPQMDSILVEQAADIAKLNIDRALQHPNLQWLREVAREMVALNQGRRSIFISGRAPFTLAGHLASLETLARSIYKNPQLVDKLLDFTAELSARYFEFMLDFDGSEGIDGLFIPDPSASGDVLSAKHFAATALPRLTQLAKRLHRHNKLTLLHICGNITDRLPLLPQTGLQMISMESKVDLAYAKQVLGGKMAIAGNVHPVQVLETGSIAEVEQQTLACLQAAAHGGGYMLMPGCDLSAKVPEQNVKVFVETANNWSKNER